MASSNKQLGKNIQKRRKVCGLTQDELADAADVSYSTVTKIERGAIVSPSVFTISCLARELDTTIESLLGSAPMEEEQIVAKPSNTFLF